MNVAELRQVLKEKVSFKSRQLNAIESKTGFGLGELAIQGTPGASDDADFSALMKGWDKVARLCGKKASSVK